MAYPHVTGTLRLCAGLSEGPSHSTDTIEERIARKRTELTSRQRSDNCLTWVDFKRKLCINGMLSTGKIRELLKEYKGFVRDIVGRDTIFSTVDEAAVFIFKLFYRQPEVGSSTLLELKSMFGPVERSLAVRIADLVREIISLAPPENIESVFDTPKELEEHDDKYFGYGCHVNKFEPLNLVDEFEDFVEHKDVFDELSMKYVEPKNVPSVVHDKQQVRHNNYDFNWVKIQVRSNFKDSEDVLGTQGINDICSSTFNDLVSEKSDEELQNDLFELLGFDRFELIQTLLEHRQEIVKSNAARFNASCTSLTLEHFKSEGKAVANKGIGITVQSEQEKSIRKWARKEERKLQKIIDVGEGELENDLKCFRSERDNAIMTAKRAPIFAQRGLAQRHNYPHVYDVFSNLKNMAGFINGKKLLLPEGIERVNNNMYEMVDIPPVMNANPSFEKHLFPITSLDEIGQLAFSGTKYLNQIQSIVFDAAYHTNGNLLICAPTGAGKTNIAMLCVLREIKQHVVGGKVNLNAFKIVYIAPMKALAAEMVNNFGKRLGPLGIKVRELTGDIQLTKSEIKETQMLVTTPEKWDVVTRKSVGDVSLALLVKLLIIDEVHLLHGERGPVLESLVARTLRQVETSQTMIRLVGLSATLPNYLDVAKFLSVNPYTGLFYFDNRFRPVPLGMTFIGVKSLNPLQQSKDMDIVCYERILKLVNRGHQVMVFVHARNATVRSANVLKDMALNEGSIEVFSVERLKDFGIAHKQVMKSRNKQLRELFPYGFSFHHAGMLRQDRSLVEKLFASGLIKVLVCTATLAWGVNLPAHAVIIKGTELYDAKHGSYVDLGILDVMQIFGRAGRPQYDTSGHGTIITSHDKLAHYLSLLTCQSPIESHFIQSLVDNLNAEVALGTVSNVEEAVHWLSYTYLHIRMRANPIAYGINYGNLMEDPDLINKRRELVTNAARQLEKAQMMRFDENTGYMNITDLGRTASHFYIKHATVETFNDVLKSVMSDAEVFAMISEAQEFDQLKVRDDELDELDEHVHSSCKFPVPGGAENSHGKVNILMQTYVSQGKLNSFSLISDQAYIMQNATRIMRAMFEVVLRKNWAIMAGRILTLSKVLEHQAWAFDHPLRQFRSLGYEVLTKLEKYNLNMDKLRELTSEEIGHFIRHVSMGGVVKRCVGEFPNLGLDATIHPITRSVLRVHLSVTPDFRWNDHVHGRNAESFWIWVEDPSTNHIYHSEYFILTKKQVIKHEVQTLVFTIPISEPLPSQYIVRAESDRWLGSLSSCPISFQHLILPERHPPNTDLLDLRPLPVDALEDCDLEALYNFTHFNPIQTQIFHLLYHSDTNILLGAPTGSGKTIVAEIAMFRVFKVYPGTKIVYIAPLKALVRERIEDWKIRLERRLNRNVVELTGDVTPDVRAIENADVIVTTPEKWDGISRSWQTRNYVKSVSLIVIDEIHLLGEDRGPVLEVIVSRTNFITSHTGRKLRIIGLSTALANARDLADWLGIDSTGLYNFRPSVRPVPMEVHIQGFPGKHYCPRMATMNKPIFQAIRTYSPKKPSLVFVSSRRQTRLTALDLIAYLAAENNPKQWLNMPEAEMDDIISTIKETNLKLTLSFGIAIHHAGLQERDRKTVEQLFVEGKIQVLIATATLAWGVNFPAHLVVVKGTEYFDGKKHRYVDFPITDVLQMIGRAGRPQFDDHGVAVVLVHDIKKHFYKKFLYEPFPVESSLLQVLHDHINAEIVAGTISSKQEAMDYLTWTYFFRRLLLNPTYYGLAVLEGEHVNKYLSMIIDGSLSILEQAGCIEIDEDNRTLISTTIGRIASYYYLSHQTVHMFKEKLTPETKLEQLLVILCNATEYAELPVRHNEDGINGEFAKVCPIAVDPLSYDSPHTKAHLLFQAHFSRLSLPCTDYITDQKSVLDQAIRILQAIIDIVADQGWLCTTLLAINLMQMVIQARWLDDDPFLTLPHIEHTSVHCFLSGKKTSGGDGKSSNSLNCLPKLMASCHTYESLAVYLRRELDERIIDEVFKVLKKLPIINVKLSIVASAENDYGQQHSTPIPIKPYDGKRPDSHWIQVVTGKEYILNVDIMRLNAVKRNDCRAHAPKFPKVKDEGWILILGDPGKREVLALKRIGFAYGRHSYQLVFFTPVNVGRVIYNLFLMSDSYLGLDQQYEVCLDVISASNDIH